MGTGFLFWAVAARFVSPQSLGIASTTISIAGLIVIFGTFGAEYSVMRFYHNYENKSQFINTFFTSISILSVIATTIFVIISIFLVPDFHREYNSFLSLLLFYALVLFSGIYLILQRQFTVLKPFHILVQTGIASTVRFIPLIIFGIFLVTTHIAITISWFISLFLATIIGILFNLPSVLPGYRFKFEISKEVIKAIRSFSMQNYVVNLLSSSVSLLLPMIIFSILSAAQSAYFFAAWSISNVLFNIPMASSQIVLAHGSVRSASPNSVAGKELKFSMLILLPIAVIVFIWAEFITKIAFGQVYSDNGMLLLRLLSISSVPLCVNLIYFAKLSAESKMKNVIIFNAFITLLTLLGGSLLLKPIGILGIGISWLCAQVLSAIFSAINLYKDHKRSYLDNATK